MARARATLSGDNYATQVDARSHHLMADEPPSLGGGDAGASPYELLLASLGACTAITLKMYADRKGWPLKTVEVALHHAQDEARRSQITRELILTGDLDEDQRARLADIAERTPVTLTLKNGADIATTLAPDPVRAHQDAELDEALEESFPASDPPGMTLRE